MNIFHHSPQPLTTDRRCIAAARTLLFNYGQGMWTPHHVYLDCCHLLQVKGSLTPLPDMQPIQIPISFFSKKIHTTRIHVELSHPRFWDRLRLYNPWEEKTFLDLPSAMKLNWLRAFTDTQHLLFNFSSDQHATIFSILEKWNRPAYDYYKIPFSASLGTAVSA